MRPTLPEQGSAGGYLRRWRQLERRAWLYLCHAALLTGSLAMTFLVFNLAIVALGLPPLNIFGVSLPLLGVLGSLGVAAAALMALPLLWLINRIGFWWALVGNALLQATSMFTIALLPASGPLLLAAALTGIGGVLFQVSSVPFILRLSTPATRDHLFSANFAVNIGVAGLATQVAGILAVRYAALLDVPQGDPLAYRAVFATAGVGLLLSLVPLLFIGRRQHHDETTSAAAATGQPEHDDELSGEFHPGEPRTLPGRLWHTLLAQPPLNRVLALVAEPWRSLVRQPWPMLRFMLPPFLISCGAALLIPYLNLFFSRKFDISDDLLGSIFTALGLTAGLAALAGPALSIRIGKMQTIVLAQLLSLPFLLLVGFAPLLAVAVGAALVRQMLFNMGSPLYDAYAMEHTPEALRPTVIGAINGAFAAGYLVMPVVSTIIQEQQGFAPLFLMTGMFYLLAVCANYWLFVRGSGDGRAMALYRT